MKIALPVAADTSPMPGSFPMQPGTPVFHHDNVITEPH